MKSIIQFGGGCLIGAAFLYVYNLPANEDIHFQIHKPAGTMKPQFSYTTKSGEVIELADAMPRKPDGTIKGGERYLIKAMRKVRPELAQELRDTLEARKRRMDELFPKPEKPLFEPKPNSRSLFRKRKITK